ncbi:hypothetical protein [Persicirhabdus sediminis]|uniref:Uncharacterized protein n=1 Tax=Persicirhabdus sediminis TaxID=454144 RepID=A0A8J7SJA6_9BACT|nr:hypothetical protein [Persicirhabdus sediminis]MBK1792015.1 hypothetical protein [Persicirhabdus sediminis]
METAVGWMGVIGALGENSEKPEITERKLGVDPLFMRVRGFIEEKMPDIIWLVACACSSIL